MSYYPIFFLFVSFLGIFNSHAILIKCNVVDISKLDKDNYPEYINFYNLDIPSKEITEKTNINFIKNKIKRKKNLLKEFVLDNQKEDIINNIKNYIILNACHCTYGITYLNFESSNIIIPDYNLKKLKNEENGENNYIVLNFLSEENFKKLKSITIKNLLATVEGETKSFIKINISITNLQEGFYKKNWNYSIFNYVFHNFQKKIEELENELKMKFLNDGSDFRILQNENPVNILHCLKNNKCGNLSIELQFSYKLIFEVEYKSKNKDFEIRDDFEEEDFKNENGNEYKTLKYSHKDFGERCNYYKNLVIIIKKKDDFIGSLKKNFYSEDSHTDLNFIINNTDINSVDINNLLGKKNNLKVICSEFSEYVKSYVINLRFAVDNITAGIYKSEYSICKQLSDLNPKKLAFIKKEDITAKNIKKKLNIINDNAISDEITIEVSENKHNENFNLNKFRDGMYICLNINKDYALENNIIVSKEPDKVAENNFNATVNIFNNKKSESGNYNQQNFDINIDKSTKKIKDIKKDNKNNKYIKNIKNLNPKCCCNCCLNCCK